jgi:hypothetical protein
MAFASVAYSESNGAFRFRSRPIPLTPGAGCSVLVVSVEKAGYVLVSSKLSSSKSLP